MAAAVALGLAGQYCQSAYPLAFGPFGNGMTVILASPGGQTLTLLDCQLCSFPPPTLSLGAGSSVGRVGRGAGAEEAVERPLLGLPKAGRWEPGLPRGLPQHLCDS